MPSPIAKALLSQIKLSPDLDISNAASAFTDVVKGYMRYIEDDASMEEQKKAEEEKVIGELFEVFFQYSSKWAEAERKKYLNQKDDPEAKKLKEQASNALKALQDSIIRFSLIYMHIGRCAAVVHKDMKSNEVRGIAVEKNFKWTADTTRLLKRYLKERIELKTNSEALREGLPILEKTDELLASLREALEKVHKTQKVDTLISGLRSGLRTANFTKANRILQEMSTPSQKFTLDKKLSEQSIEQIKQDGAAIIKAFEENEEQLKSPERKLYLTMTELKIIIDAQEREIDQKTKYINKYHQPFIENKYKSISHIKDKLLILSSLESLITLYMRLMRGLSCPLNDIKEIRTFEAEVIENINYILKGQFQDISLIESRLEDAMVEYYNVLTGINKG